MERLQPGHQLASLSVDTRDDEATEILAHTIGQMTPCHAPPVCATVEQWGSAFEGYRVSGDTQVPRHLVEQGQRLYAQLSASQRHVDTNPLDRPPACLARRLACSC